MPRSKAVSIDEYLAELYDAVKLATRGQLFSPGRWKAIWDLNTGKYRAAMNKTGYPRADAGVYDVSF